MLCVCYAFINMKILSQYDHLLFFSSRGGHTSGALVTGVQTCALPISGPIRSRSRNMETCWSLPPADRIPAAAVTCRQRRLNGAEVYRDARHARHGVDCLTVAVETDELVGDAAVDAIIPVFRSAERRLG